MLFKALFAFSALLAAVATTTEALPATPDARNDIDLAAEAFVNQFSLTITSTSPNVEQLMIVLNPNLIALQGTNYQTYFPVVWKVVKFTANSNLVGKPEPVTVSYASNISTVLQQITVNNIVNSADYEPVVRSGEEFLINDLGGGQYNLVDSGKNVPGSSAAISNPIANTFNVGLGDASGSSYLTMGLGYQNTLAFTFNAEFAIVPVGLTVQDSSKLVSGSVLRPWFSFKLTDLQTESPSFTFDGTTIVNAQGFAKITNHPSDEVVFGGSSSAK